MAKPTDSHPFSVAGLQASGLSGAFYQHYWDILGNNIFKMVQDFFICNSLPKSKTHTNLVVLSKKEQTRSLCDLRPISLSKFINKILSGVVHDIIEV